MLHSILELISQKLNIVNQNNEIQRYIVHTIKIRVSRNICVLSQNFRDYSQRNATKMSSIFDVKIGRYL